MPMLGPVVSGLAFIGVGLLLFRSAVRRTHRSRCAPDGAEGIQPVLPVEILREAVESYAPYLQASGEMHDPAFGKPTQYGTPYHALCNAVLARDDAGGKKSAHADRAVRGLEPALDNVIDPWLPPTASGFDGATGAVGRSKHKDFFWPPILKTFLILRDSLWLGVPQDEDPDNAFKIQWEMFLGHVAAGEPFPYDLLKGAKGVQLAELGLQSWRERRWLEVPELEPSRTPHEELGHA